MATAKYHVGDRLEDAETGTVVTGTVVHPPCEYVTIVASLIVAAICLAILLAFIVFSAPAEAHGVERLKQKISVREQWLATCSHSPRREECYHMRPGSRTPSTSGANLRR
jgi:hypothetical protein